MAYVSTGTSPIRRRNGWMTVSAIKFHADKPLGSHSGYLEL